MNKSCSKCKIKKELTQFSFRKDRNNYRSQCKLCVKSNKHNYYQKNKKKFVENNKIYYKQNKEKCLELSKNYYIKNLEKELEYRKIYQRNHLEDHRKRCKKYRQNNKQMVTFQTRKRQLIKTKATPTWVNQDHIKLIYLECPKDMNVDHIIPLNGLNVCGLHVPWNLQYLTPLENTLKKNHFDGTQENESWRKKYEKVA